MTDYIKRIYAAADAATRAKMERIIELYAKNMIMEIEMHDLFHRAWMEGKQHENGFH